MPVGYHQYPPYQHEQLVQSGHPGPHHAQNTYVSLQSDLGEEHYSSLAFNAAVLAMNSDPNNNNGMTASSSKNLDLCHCEDKVCQVEGGVKFNPFYVREMRRREDAPPTTRKKRMGSSSALCDVLMDSVVHSSHVAAAHAEQANCMQCREFVHKFRNDVRDMINTEKEIYERQISSSSFDVEKALKPSFYRNSAAAPRDYRPKVVIQDGRIKLMAYISVVILCILLLVIVIIVLTLFFAQSPFMEFSN